MNRTFYAVTVCRAIPVDRMLERAEAAGIGANFRVDGSTFFDARRDSSARSCRTELTLYHPLQPLSHRDNDSRLDAFGGEGLRPANLHDGIEFAIAHRKAFLAALPLIMIGDVVALPDCVSSTSRFVPSFRIDGKGRVYLNMELGYSNYWDGYNFLAA
ncbi:MAG: hypothetical protein AAB554_01220, partial [Patescibacteria group bacterium]